MLWEHAASYLASDAPPREDEVPEHVGAMHVLLFPTRELAVVWRELALELAQTADRVGAALDFISDRFCPLLAVLPLV